MSYAVPQVAGVPQVLGGFSPVAAVAAVFSDAAGLPQPSIAPQWGIFLNGAPVVVSDNVAAMDARQEWVIADYPVEGGAFESYDKVQRPFDVRFRFTTGGSASARSTFVQSVKAIAGDFNLYMFIAPDDVWENVSVSHFDYHRTASSGLGLLPIDVWGWQIQINAASGTGGITSGQNPGSNASSSISSVQGTTPSTQAHLQVYDAPYISPSNFPGQS